MTADLLSAMSILVTATGALFGLWYKDMTAVLDWPEAPKRADREPHIKRANDVLKSQCLPLTLFVLGLLVVFLRPVAVIVAAGVRSVASDPVEALVNYDPISLAFVLLYTVAVALAVTTVRVTYRVWRLLCRLKVHNGR